MDGFECESAVGKIAKKAGFGLPAQPSAEQVDNFGDDERGNDEWAGVRL
jgi:hypothetical protein